jgi:hypothetical protein
MISLTIYVDNIGEVVQVFDRVQVRRYTGSDLYPDPDVTDAIALTDYATVSGTDTINDRENVSDVALRSDYYQYYFTDPDGFADNWYISRYYSTSDGSTSGWSAPIQGDPGDLYYNPQFPAEIVYGSSDQLIIDRIRLWIGDPLGLRREYGEEALSSIHPDGKTYEMDEMGWPAYINMGGVQFTDTDNPSVNGYRFLRFQRYIDDVCTECVTYSGVCGEDVVKEVTHGVDIWYYTHRFSNRQIMEAYDNCPPPTPLTTTTANSEVYMLQTAIDLLRGELWEDATEDGARIKDEGSNYDPSPGLEVRRKLLDDLVKRRDDMVKALQLTGITGVLID